MSDYPTSSISGSTAHVQHQYEPLPGDANTPWNHPRTRGEIDEQNHTLFRTVALLGNVINNEATPSILVLKDVLTTAHFDLVKNGRWICLSCALQPAKPHKITKSRNKTIKITKVDYAAKPDLLQHINLKHIRALVNENYLYKELICTKRYGMQTDMTAHNKVCAEKCKSKALDKLTHQELEHMAEDLHQASLNAKNAMDLAERALPVLFDEVDGGPLKRYDFSDGTNNLKLRPRINRSMEGPTGVADGGLTASVSFASGIDPDPEQVLRNALRVFQNSGPLGRQRALQITNEMMSTVDATIHQPGPPSGQTQPLDTGEQLSLARNRKYAASNSQSVPEETAPPPPGFANLHPIFTAAQPQAAAPSSDGAHSNYLNAQTPISGTQLAEWPEDWPPPLESELMEFTRIRALQCSASTEPNYSDYLRGSASEDGTAGHLDNTGDTAMSDVH